MSPVLLKPGQIIEVPRNSLLKNSQEEATISTLEGSPIPKVTSSIKASRAVPRGTSMPRDSHRVLSLLDKKLEYSKKVRALFRPRIDPLKQVEAQLARLKTEAVPHSPRAQLIKSSSLKPQPFVPVVQPDYLEIRRKVRTRVEGALLQRSNTDVDLRRAAGCSPDRQEALLNQMLRQNPHNLELLEAETQLNELYLAKIRSKLQLLG